MNLFPMTPAQWQAVRDNPIQRDTEEHAKKALRGHLSKYSETQCVVAAAVLPDGEMIKLDGHTRGLLWSDGRLKAPPVVRVFLHHVKNEAEAIELYKHFDNPAAAEGAADRLAGAYRFHDMHPQSRLLKAGGIMSALNIIDNSRKNDVYANVGLWKKELMMLDRLDGAKHAMPFPLICAALLTLRKYGEAALDFWLLYCAGGGTRVDGKSCGVDELTRIVADLRARGALGTGGDITRRIQAGRAVSCCDAWMNGRYYTTGAKATDITTYLDDARSRMRDAVRMVSG